MWVLFLVSTLVAPAVVQDPNHAPNCQACEANGGTCWNNQSGYFESCLCPETRSGAVCEHVHDPNATTHTSNCMACKANDGYCVMDQAGDFKNCSCPVTRSGAECEHVHVQVQCNYDTFSMDICYDPYPGVDRVIGSEIYAFGHEDDPACHAAYDYMGWCDIGSYFLTLPLVGKEMARCGTRRINLDSETQMYRNSLLVSPWSECSERSPLIMNVDCSFGKAISNVDTVDMIQWTNIGSDMFDKLDFWITTLENQTTESVMMNSSDFITMNFKLIQNDKYEAFRVENCFHSSHPLPYDTKAYKESLLTNGCPQPFFGSGETYYYDAHQANESVDLYKFEGHLCRFGGSSTSFVHCEVRVCPSDLVSSCLPLNCANSLGSRKRRAAENRVLLVEVSANITWAQ